MKKQIYCYLQRSLVKVFMNSVYSNKYKPSVARLSHPSIRLADSKLSQKKGKKRLIALITLQKKKFNFFRTVNIKDRLSFTCKFSLLNFTRSSSPVFVNRSYARIFENFIKYSDSRFVKCNQEKNIDEFFLKIALLWYFYPQTFYRNCHLFQTNFYRKRIFNFFLVGKNSFSIYNIFTLKIINVEANNASKLFCIGKAKKRKIQLLTYSKKVKIFFIQVKVLNKKQFNLHFYQKIQGVTLALALEAVTQCLHSCDKIRNKKLCLNKSLYIRKKNYQNLLNFFNKHITWNVLIYQFNYTTEIIEQNFNFQPFYKKRVLIQRSVNSYYFFLMRPLFSITRLDTFFICESLKLPIYPDKSNLTVDFLRNRVRKQILPAIRILLNPQFDTILCKFNELV